MGVGDRMMNTQEKNITEIKGNSIDTNIVNSVYSPRMLRTLESFAKIQASVAQSIALPSNSTMQNYQNVAEALRSAIAPYGELYKNIESSLSSFVDAVSNVSYQILSFTAEDLSSDEQLEVNSTNEKIITEIFQPDQEKKIDIEESPIIILSPINEKVLKFLSENPDALYQLSGNDFEIVMSEIYSRLGYDVTRTQATRDGGKDIIIRRTDTLGDFIYYVECKKYAAQRPVGVGIIRNLLATVNTDRVNGGILATTSFFTKPARRFVLDNQWSFQIQMHDYDKIKSLLKQIV